MLNSIGMRGIHWLRLGIGLISMTAWAGPQKTAPSPPASSAHQSAAPRTPPILDGSLDILFKKSATARQRQDLHKELGNTLFYSGESVPIDTVHPPKKETLKEAELNIICERYKKSPLVEACEIRRPLSTNQAAEPAESVDEDCRPNLETLPPLLAFQIRDVTERLRRCEVVPHHGMERLMGTTLSPLWAQEMVGADLIRADWRPEQVRRPARYFMFETVSTSALDPSTLPEDASHCNGSETPYCWSVRFQQSTPSESFPRSTSHGTAVSRLVSDPLFGVGVGMRMATYATGSPTNTPITDVATLDRAVRQQADLLCSSTGALPRTEPSPVIQAMHASFQARGGIIAQSASNLYLQERERNYPPGAIVVGSISPSGLTSWFSNEGPGVTIAAPSDSYIRSDRSGDHANFGGTSGAQPLVCGAIGNLISLLPGLTAEEARKILEETAIPTQNSREVPRRNGVGMLNAYGAFRVAQRLQAGWPGNRQRISQDQSLFSFVGESTDLLRSVQDRLRSHDSCETAEVLRTLRRAFFLNPRNPFLVRPLMYFYSRAGLTQNANFISTLRPLNDEELAFLSEDSYSTIRSSALRQLSRRGAAGEAVLRRTLANLIAREPGASQRFSAESTDIIVAAHELRRLHPEEPILPIVAQALRRQDPSPRSFGRNLLDLASEAFGFTAEQALEECLRGAQEPTLVGRCLVHVNDALRPVGDPNPRMDAVINAMDARLEEIPPRQRRSVISDLALRGESGRAFLRRQLEQHNYPQATQDMIRNTLRRYEEAEEESE